MKMLQSFLLALVTAMTLLGAGASSAQQSFQLSSKFYQMQLSGKQPMWDGQHHFGNVFCLKFPRANNAETLAEALYNENTLYFGRVAYNDMTALYVAISPVPEGRTVEDEIGNLTAQSKKRVEEYPRNFGQKEMNGELGPSVKLVVRNAKEGGRSEPFPFVRPFDTRADAPLTSLSVHRLFVHEHDRIEVAGLRYFKEPVDGGHEAQAVADLSALVEQAAVSLQSCTAKLPPSVQ